jgi:hypothetical protein
MLPEQVTSTVSQSQQVSDFVGWWRLCAALERQFMREHVACLSLRGRVSVLRDARGHSGNDSTMLEVLQPPCQKRLVLGLPPRDSRRETS